MTADDSGGERISPLELLHPGGAVQGVLVDGDAALGIAVPAGVGDRVDLCVLAPSREQWRSRHWLPRALEAAVPKLAPDALVYLVAPPRHRRRARRVLKRHGLRVGAVVVHVPDLGTSRYLVPLDRVSAGSAFMSLVAVWPRRRRVIALALRLPGGRRALEALLSSLAFVAQGPEAPPPFSWFSRHAGGGDDRTADVVVTSGRASDDRLVLISLPNRKGSGHVVGKVRERGSRELEQEGANLAAITPQARVAGARVPERLDASPSLPDRALLIETGVPGMSAAALLGSRPRAFPRVLALLADWLEAWNRATLVVREPELEELERHVLAPVELLARDLEDGEEYAAWLAERCRRVSARPIPFVAAHNDLTMFNVLVDDDRLGIVDWEAAAVAQFPLTDFVYAAVDAAAASQRYADRARALEECFVPGGRHAATVASLHGRLTAALGVAPDVAELSFHACWLQHAANERRRKASISDGPFRVVLERVASMRRQNDG